MAIPFRSYVERTITGPIKSGQVRTFGFGLSSFSCHDSSQTLRRMWLKLGGEEETIHSATHKTDPTIGAMVDPLENTHEPYPLSVGQRLCRSRFVLKSELFTNPEGSIYWLADDRDEQHEVILFLPPKTIGNDDQLRGEFFNQVQAWTEATGSEWHSVVFYDPEAKPYPLVALQSLPGVSIGKRLMKEGQWTNWEHVEPLLEKLTQHLVEMHQAGLTHGRLSPDNIRFLPNDDILFLGPQLDRIVLKTLHKASDQPTPDSWDLHASAQCLKSGECQAEDEVYAFASILLETIRTLGIHVQLPENIDLHDKIRFGNLLVPKSVKEALLDALDSDPGKRPDSAVKLAVSLGFDLKTGHPLGGGRSDSRSLMETSENLRRMLKNLLQPKVFFGVIGVLLMIFAGWFIVEWDQQRKVEERVQEKQSLNQNLALDIRASAPNETAPMNLKGTSTLSVSTTPSEALLSLSGPGVVDKKEDFSPVVWSQLKEGAYQISALAIGYMPTNFYTFLEPGKTNLVSIQLIPTLTQVALKTEPAGGFYRFINQEGALETGKTPATVGLKPGEYLFHFSLNGEKRAESFSLKSSNLLGKTIVARFGTCMLDIQTLPPEVEIWLDDAMWGQSPYLKDSLPPGEMKLVFKKEGYVSVTKNVTLTEEEPTVLRVLLEPVDQTP